jgi:hypothetical protein
LITAKGDENSAVYELTFNNEDMFGNPYNFMDYFHQEKAFDISIIDGISKVELYLYQANNFIDGDGKELFNDVIDKSIFLDNIFVKDIELFFGFNSKNFTEETLMLSTKDSLKFSKEEAEEYIEYERDSDGNVIYSESKYKEISRTIYLNWVH